MNYLDVKTLKIARQVCSLWNFESTKTLFNKTLIFPVKLFPAGKMPSKRESKRLRNSLKQFVSLSGSSINLRLGTRYFDDAIKSKIIYVLQKLPEFSKRIQLYQFQGSSRNSEISSLARILRYLPNVQIVSTSNFNFRNTHTWADLKENSSDDSSESEDEIEEEEEEGNKIENKKKVTKNNMEIFLSKLETLKELKIQCGISVFDFSEFMPYHNRLRAITEISLTDKPVQGEINNLTHFRDFLKLKSQWPISQLAWKLTPQLEQSLVRQFFITISQTLENLDIDLRSLHVIQEEHWIDNWYLPIEMPKLENLKLVGHDMVLKKGLTVALQMTQLKKLVIHSGLKSLNKFINEWECCHLAMHRKLQSLSIQELEIQGKLTIKDLVLLDGRLWPNLKSLKIGSFSITLLKYNLIKHWKNLEHLELDFSEMKSKDLEVYENWMTGISSPAVYKSPVILVSQKDDDDMDTEDDDDNELSPVSLRELQNLKSLTFHHYRLTGDFVLYNCLQLLKNLQTLQFKDSRVSAKGIADLKKTFGDGRISILVDNKYI